MMEDNNVMSAQEIQQIEVTIDELEASIKKADDLRVLEDNEFFKRVILDGYMEKNAIRLVHLKGASQMQDEKQQKGIDNQLMGIAMLGEHFRAIYGMAELAKKRLDDYTNELDSVNGANND